MQDLIEILRQQSMLGLNSSYSWAVYAIALTIGGFLMFAWMSLMAMAWTYGERRIAGFIQGRIGPNRVGPEGILQPIADGIKLLTKEDVIPQIAYKVLYTMGPLIVFIGAFLPFAALPFTDRLYVVNMELALFYILAFEAIEVIGVLMAGWAPGSKWSLYGGMRLAAQMLAYEIPMGLCALVIIVLSGSINLLEIVAWQESPLLGIANPWIFGWAIFRSPAAFLAFFMFFVGGLASTKRAPFDLPEAESEIVAGYHTEYSGIRFAFFFLSEYASMYLVCALSVILFLGGWSNPIPRPSVPEDFILTNHLLNSSSGLWSTLFDGATLTLVANQTIGVINLLIKSFTLYFIMIWARWTLPRVRVDQVLYMCLKVFLPFSLGCIVWALVQVVVFGG